MRSVVFTVVILFVIISCDYQPNGEFNVVLPEPDPAGMSVALTESKDTISLWGYAQISYRSVLQNQESKFFRAYLNDEQVVSGPTGQPESFSIYTYNLDNGYYSMRIELDVTTGTGSLGEKRQLEYIHLSKTYVVYIDNDPPDPVEITSVRRVDGTLELTWRKYAKPNFIKYSISKYDYNPYYQYFVLHWTREITDNEIQSFRDSAFIGGKVKYAVTVLAGEKQSVTEKEFEDPYDLNVQWEWVDKTNIKFTWRKTPYYRNFTSYSISFLLDDPDTRVLTVDNVNDTTLTFEARVIFPRTKYARVMSDPNNLETYYRSFAHGDAVFYLGNPFPLYSADYYYYDHDHCVYNASLDKYFATQIISYDRQKLMRINSTTYEIEEEVETFGNQFVLSDNGQHLYAISGGSFTKFDPLDFSVSQNYDVSQVLHFNATQWLNSLSNNNQLAIWNITGYYVLDMNTFSLVQQWPYESQKMTISSTGMYIMLGADLLQWNSSQYVKVGTFSSSNKAVFIEDDNRLLLYKNSSIDVINLNTLTLERTIATEVFNLRYDPVSGLVGGGSEPYSNNAFKFYLYSPNSSDKVAGFNIDGGMLMNNSLVLPGFVLPLSQYYP